MKRKMLFVSLLCVTLIVALAACGGSSSSGGSSSESEDKTLTIGFIGPLTGEAAAFSTPERNTLEWLVEDLNAEGGIAGYKIDLKIYDNRNDTVETTNAAKKAITADGVDIIIGTNASGTSLALAGVCDEYKVPHIATTATNGTVTMDDEGNPRPYSFRVCMSDPDMAIAMAYYAYNTLGYRTIGILQEVSSDYSVGMAQNFTDAFTALGGQVIDTESYTTGDVDFRAQFAKLKEANPDAFFLTMLYKELALGAVQARDLGITQPFLGPDVWAAMDLYDLAGEAIVGARYINALDAGNPDFDEFKKEYQEKFGAPCDGAGLNAYYAYDALMVVKDAVERTGSNDAAVLRDALEETKDVQSITGSISIGKDHRAVRAGMIIEITAEGHIVIDEVTVEQ